MSTWEHHQLIMVTKCLDQNGYIYTLNNFIFDESQFPYTLCFNFFRLYSYLKLPLYSSPSCHYSILIPKIKWSIIWKQYLYFVLGFNFNFHETGIIHLKPRKLLLSSHHIMKWSRCYKNIKWKKLYISFIIQYTYCIPSLKVIPILRGTRCQHLFYYVHVTFPYKPNINNNHPFVNRLNVNYKNPHWGYLQTNWELIICH